MDCELAEDQWEDLKPEVQKRWVKLTDDDLAEIMGHTDELLKRIQVRYGISEDIAVRQLQEFHQTLH